LTKSGKLQWGNFASLATPPPSTIHHEEFDTSSIHSPLLKIATLKVSKLTLKRLQTLKIEHADLPLNKVVELEPPKFDNPTICHETTTPEPRCGLDCELLAVHLQSLYQMMQQLAT
jgi:hypothetical protein